MHKQQNNQRNINNEMSILEKIYRICIADARVISIMDKILMHFRIEKNGDLYAKCVMAIKNYVKAKMQCIKRTPSTREEINSLINKIMSGAFQYVHTELSKKKPELLIKRRSVVKGGFMNREVDVHGRRDNHVHQRPYTQTKKDYVDDDNIINMERLTGDSYESPYHGKGTGGGNYAGFGENYEIGVADFNKEEFARNLFLKSQNGNSQNIHNDRIMFQQNNRQNYEQNNQEDVNAINNDDDFYESVLGDGAPPQQITQQTHLDIKSGDRMFPQSSSTSNNPYGNVKNKGLDDDFQKLMNARMEINKEFGIKEESKVYDNGQNNNSFTKTMSYNPQFVDMNNFNSNNFAGGQQMNTLQYNPNEFMNNQQHNSGFNQTNNMQYNPNEFTNNSHQNSGFNQMNSIQYNPNNFNSFDTGIRQPNLMYNPNNMPINNIGNLYNRQY